MIDNNAEVYAALNAVGIAYKQYPKSFATFPVISYWDSGHTADGFLNGKSTIDTIETTVDVWEKEDINGNFIEVHSQMDSAMRANGFIRSNPIVCQYEIDTFVTHYTAKYKKPYEEVN